MVEIQLDVRHNAPRPRGLRRRELTLQYANFAPQTDILNHDEDAFKKPVPCLAAARVPPALRERGKHAQLRTRHDEFENPIWDCVEHDPSQNRRYE